MNVKGRFDFCTDNNYIATKDTYQNSSNPIKSSSECRGDKTHRESWKCMKTFDCKI